VLKLYLKILELLRDPLVLTCQLHVLVIKLAVGFMVPSMPLNLLIYGRNN
jgi:hypothetical protein